MTVMLMEARQYARIDSAGLFVIWETGMGSPAVRGAVATLGSGDDLLLISGISMAKSSSFLLPSILADSIPNCGRKGDWRSVCSRGFRGNYSSCVDFGKRVDS
jgi:hypothetical protein